MWSRWLDGPTGCLTIIRKIMFTVISVIVAGVVAGYLFKRVAFLQKVEKSISWTVLLLLFVMGVSIGSNPLIVDNLWNFGGQAALFALLTIVGSLLASLMVFRLFFKKGGDDEK